MPRQLFALLARVRIEQEHRMFIPQVYTVCTATMAALTRSAGKLGHMQKATGTCRFELFLLDVRLGHSALHASRRLHARPHRPHEP